MELRNSFTKKDGWSRFEEMKKRKEGMKERKMDEDRREGDKKNRYKSRGINTSRPAGFESG